MQKKAAAETLTRLTDVKMVSILFWGKFSAFLDHAVPAIVSSILVNCGVGHDEEMSWDWINGTRSELRLLASTKQVI